MVLGAMKHGQLYVALLSSLQKRPRIKAMFEHSLTDFFSLP